MLFSRVYGSFVLDQLIVETKTDLKSPFSIQLNQA
jgi:hypothetical protein